MLQFYLKRISFLLKNQVNCTSSPDCFFITFLLGEKIAAITAATIPGSGPSVMFKKPLIPKKVIKNIPKNTTIEIIIAFVFEFIIIPKLLQPYLLQKQQDNL